MGWGWVYWRLALCSVAGVFSHYSFQRCWVLFCFFWGVGGNAFKKLHDRCNYLST